jgi:steroid delta-isomerase-like uncharacterized protein
MTSTDTPTSAQKLSDEELIRLQREVVDYHIRMENEGNWEEVYDTFAGHDGVFYDVTAMHMRFHGMEGVKEYYTTVADAVPDFQVIVNAEYDVPNTLIREITIRGTHTGTEFAGIPATGKKIKFDIIAMYIFDPQNPAKLIAERTYFDGGTMLRQMTGEEVAE